MRILFIGDTSLPNDAIKRVLLSEDGWEVCHYEPAEVEKNNLLSEDGPFDLSLVDFYSISDEFEGFNQIKKKIRNWKLADNIVVLDKVHEGDSADSIKKQLIEAGADDYVSINSDTEKLLETISSFKRK